MSDDFMSIWDWIIIEVNITIVVKNFSFLLILWENVKTKSLEYIER